MKQRTNISWFLMIVSLIMLTASVFPHHHHQALLCLQHDLVESVHECNSSTNCDHSHATSEDKACGEDTAGTGCNDCCITVFHCSEPDDSYDSMEPQYTLESILFTLTNIYFLPLQSEESKADYYTFYHETLHSKHFTKALGLRGPPAPIV